MTRRRIVVLLLASSLPALQAVALGTARATSGTLFSGSVSRADVSNHMIERDVPGPAGDFWALRRRSLRSSLAKDLSVPALLLQPAR